MNKYEIQCRKDDKWFSYTIYRNGQPFQGGIMRTKSAAMKQAELELKKLQRSEPLAA